MGTPSMAWHVLFLCGRSSLTWRCEHLFFFLIMLSRKSSISKTLMQQRRRGHACAVLPVWCAGHIIVKSFYNWWSPWAKRLFYLSSVLPPCLIFTILSICLSLKKNIMSSPITTFSSSSQLDKNRHWHDAFADQPRNRKQKYLFHRDPPCFENKRSAQQDWKFRKNDWTFTMSTFIPTHQRTKVRQRPSLVCSSLQVFSRCNSISTGVILALLLHGLFSFDQLRPLQAWLASGAHSKAVGSTSASEGLAGFSRWRSTER